MSSANIVCDSGDTNLDAAVYLWLKLDRNMTTISEVTGYIRAMNWDHLRKVMLNRMKFGTAGMRARMCAGFSCMNDITILQTAQGLCSYLQKQCTHDQLAKGIVVGFDGRHNSKRFALFTSRVFIEANIPVTLFFEECPTPLVAYATAEIGAAAGVMVTASHNPKEDNGYKVYWSNGSQIISPHDENLLDEILQCLDIPSKHYELDGVMDDELVRDGLRLASDYAADLRDSIPEDVLMGNRKFPIQIVYSAMHGVGNKYLAQAFHYCNLKPVISVKAQMSPDPEFPTVEFPNPEEKECLVMSKLLAMQSKVKLVLANDPDADRLAVAEFDERTKEWKTFSGNEMGAILGWWLLEQYYKRNPDADPDDVYVLASVVSSKMLRAVVQGRGHFVETLTGFKWMGNTALLLKQQGKVPVFAFEEAIGYMCFPQVVDKDGISAAVHVASLATNLYSRGSSLNQQLRELYKEYGYHLTLNSYFLTEDPSVYQLVFRGIRNYDGPGKYPKKVGSAEIMYIHDLAAGVKISQEPEEEAHLNVVGTGLDREYSGGEMVTLRTRAGLSVTVRTSGTEPKLKYYSELIYKVGEHSYTEMDEEEMQSKLKRMVDDFIDRLIQPMKYGLA